MVKRLIKKEIVEEKEEYNDQDCERESEMVEAVRWALENEEEKGDWG